jgi:hypothetical protein
VKRREFIAESAVRRRGRSPPPRYKPDRARRRGIILATGKTPEYVAALVAFEQVLGSFDWKHD